MEACFLLLDCRSYSLCGLRLERDGLVTYVNIACYYIIGLPGGLVLGLTLNLGVQVEEAENPVKRWGETARE
ncbi:unnamed protein product [Cochlearia groenlandica]